MVSKITSKGQIILPKAIRKTLAVRDSDSLVYEAEGTSNRVRKADLVWQRAVSETLEKWDSPFDHEAFDYL